VNLVTDKLNKLTEMERSIMPCHTNRASSLGDKCIRKLVYYRTKWSDQEKPSIELQRRFNLGKVLEEYAIMRMLKAGVRVINTQVHLQVPEHQITGHPDGSVIDEATEEAYPFDVKSAASSVFHKLHTKEDFKQYSWTSKYIAQLMIYMHCLTKDKGFFIFIDKQSGEEKELWLDYDPVFVQELFDKADTVNKHVAAGTLPERIEYCEECSDYCPFKLLCLPDVVFKEPEFVADPELELMLKRLEELKPAKKEYDAIEKEVKDERLKPRLAPGVVGEKRKMFVGQTPIDLSWTVKKAYEVKASAYWTVKIGGGK
jgi:hypothetical protein